MSIGDIAEDLVASWGSQAGFSVTAVRRDRHGWDHFFELSIPRRPVRSGPAGIATSDLSAKIQVKGTRGSKRGVSVKLSNWKRAIEDPLPWFFVVVQLGVNDSRPREVVVVHIDQEFVERALRRIYHLPTDARRTLHKHSMAFTWTSADTITRPFGDSLKTAIVSAVGVDAFLYAKHKQAWYDNAGLEGAPVTGRFQVEARTEQELYQRLARAAVGLDDTLEVRNFSVSNVRFGVEEQDPRFPTDKEVKVKISPTGKEMERTLVVARSDGTDAVSLSCSIRFSASVFPMLPKEFWILRFQTPLMDLVLDPSTSHFNLRLDLSSATQKRPIRDLAPPFDLLRLLEHAQGSEITFQVGNALDTSPIATSSSALTLNPELLRLTRWVTDRYFAGFQQSLRFSDTTSTLRRRGRPSA